MSLALAHKVLPIYRLQLLKEGNLEYPDLDSIGDSRVASEIFHNYLSDRAQEHVAVLLIDGAGHYLGITTVSIGGISSANVFPRDVFSPIIAGRASGFILGHNHPSNDVTPSIQDIEFTKRLFEASNIIGIPFLDHIIVSSGQNKAYYSFKDKSTILDG